MPPPICTAAASTAAVGADVGNVALDDDAVASEGLHIGRHVGADQLERGVGDPGLHGRKDVPRQAKGCIDVRRVDEAPDPEDAMGVGSGGLERAVRDVVGEVDADDRRPRP
jgi:hypothetical protein